MEYYVYYFNVWAILRGRASNANNRQLEHQRRFLFLAHIQPCKFTLSLLGPGYHFRVGCDNDGRHDATVTSASYTCSYTNAGTYQVVITPIGASNLTSTVSDVPDLTVVTDLSQIFSGATKAIPNTGTPTR